MLSSSFRIFASLIIHSSDANEHTLTVTSKLNQNHCILNLKFHYIKQFREKKITLPQYVGQNHTMLGFMLNYFLKTVYATSGLIFIQFKTLLQVPVLNFTELQC